MIQAYAINGHIVLDARELAGVLLVESSSRIGVFHRTTSNPPSCSCEAWTYQHTCPHIDLATKAADIVAYQKTNADQRNSTDRRRGAHFPKAGEGTHVAIDFGGAS